MCRHCQVYWGKFLKVNTQDTTTKFSGITLFSVTITTVKFQFKFSRAKFLFLMNIISCDQLVKGKVFYDQEPPSGVSTTAEYGVNYELLAVMYWSSPNGELLVAVNHNQLWTMASETVDRIDWSHPPSSWAVPPGHLVHIINQCNLSGNRMCNRSMRGNHLAYAAAQGINGQYMTIPLSILYLLCNYTIKKIHKEIKICTQ